MATMTPTRIDGALKAVRGDGVRREISDDGKGAVEGLRLRVGGSGDRVKARWSVMLRDATGARVRVPVGEWPTMSIADARAEADRIRAAAAGGEVVGVRAAKAKAAEVEKARIPVRDLLAAYKSQRLDGLRKGNEAGRAIEGILAELLDGEASAITRAALVAKIDAKALTAPVAANRALSYVRPFMKWMMSRGYIHENPALGIEKPTKEQSRERTPSLDELTETWHATEAFGYPFAPFLRVLMLTAGRRDEVAAMRVAEIDLDAGIWSLPSSRAKNGEPHRIPLSPEVVSIIRDAMTKKPDGPFVFSTTGSTPISGFSRFKVSLDDAITEKRRETDPDASPMEDWRFHDFRRSFATACVDILHIDAAVADRCLNHTGASTSSTVARVYQRAQMIDQRRAALSAWARLVADAVAGETVVSNVIGLPRR